MNTLGNLIDRFDDLWVDFCSLSNAERNGPAWTMMEQMDEGHELLREWFEDEPEDVLRRIWLHCEAMTGRGITREALRCLRARVCIVYGIDFDIEIDRFPLEKFVAILDKEPLFSMVI